MTALVGEGPQRAAEGMSGAPVSGADSTCAPDVGE